MTARRWPALLIIPALIAGMVLVDRSSDNGNETGGSLDPVVVPPDLMPVAAPADAAISSWFCPSATGGGNSEISQSSLLVANRSDEPRTGTVTAFSAAGTSSEIAIDIAPKSRRNVRVADITDANHAGLLVEVDGGGVAASLFVEGDHGFDIANCASSAAPDWYIPMATTTLDASAVLKLFNPFPDDAVVRIEFAADGEIRVPQGFEGVPVPAGSVVSLDVTDIVTVRQNFATSIEARSGKVVAQLVQTFDGSEGIEGLSVLAGAPEGAEVWTFPRGKADDQTLQTISVYNPTETDAIVDLGVSVDDPAANGAVLPIELTVPRRGSVVLDSSGTSWSRVPPGVGHSFSVRAKNGVPVVAAQQLEYSDPDEALTSTLGAPLQATSWIVPAASVTGAQEALMIVNASTSDPVQVSVSLISEGEAELLEFELGPAERRSLSVASDFTLDGAAGVVESSGPVVVALAVEWTSGGRALLNGIPVSDSTRLPEPLEG